jgi:hypothetical protein
LYEKKGGLKVKCNACEHRCLISAGKTGICGVRKNHDGKLILKVYGLPVSSAVDPVEKKPLFHFLPGTLSYSLGTIGCNFKCGFCQNYDISQMKRFPKPLLSSQQAEGLLRSVSRQKSLIAKLDDDTTKRRGIKSNLAIKKGQEEMLGFALIMIIVAVILVIFLGLSLRKSPKEAVESYEVESFLQTALSYSTNCSNYRDSHPPVRDLIFACNSKEKCLDGLDSCKVLADELKNILNESWKVGEDTPIKGYELEILLSPNKEENEDEEPPKPILQKITQGTITGNSRGAMQDYSKGGELVEVYLTVSY